MPPKNMKWYFLLFFHSNTLLYVTLLCATQPFLFPHDNAVISVEPKIIYFSSSSVCRSVRSALEPQLHRNDHAGQSGLGKAEKNMYVQQSHFYLRRAVLTVWWRDTQGTEKYYSTPFLYNFFWLYIVTWSLTLIGINKEIKNGPLKVLWMVKLPRRSIQKVLL